jgi:hypothetical protein
VLPFVRYWSLPTITVSLGDTFSVFVEITGIAGDHFVLLGTGSFEYEKTGDFTYQLVAQNAGLFSMGAFTYDQETGEDFITYFDGSCTFFFLPDLHGRRTHV